MYLLFENGQKDAVVALAYTKLILRISANRMSCAGFVFNEDEERQPTTYSSVEHLREWVNIWQAWQSQLHAPEDAKARKRVEAFAEFNSESAKLPLRIL